jgi:hypothetical protein
MLNAHIYSLPLSWLLLTRFAHRFSPFLRCLLRPPMEVEIETPFFLSHPSSVTYLPSSIMTVSQPSQSASFSSHTRALPPTNILLPALTLLTRPCCHHRCLRRTKRHLHTYHANTNLPWSLMSHLPSRSLQTCHAEQTANEGGGIECAR